MYPVAPATTVVLPAPTLDVSMDMRIGATEKADTDATNKRQHWTTRRGEIIVETDFVAAMIAIVREVKGGGQDKRGKEGGRADDCCRIPVDALPKKDDDDDDDACVSMLVVVARECKDLQVEAERRTGHWRHSVESDESIVERCTYTPYP